MRTARFPCKISNTSGHAGFGAEGAFFQAAKLGGCFLTGSDYVFPLPPPNVNQSVLHDDPHGDGAYLGRLLAPVVAEPRRHRRTCRHSLLD